MFSPDDFYKKQVECHFHGERYAVRDNGAVFRHSLGKARIRRLDNHWTFGTINPKTGYLEIASVRVHRIVATAFWGPAPNKDYVVDHIDTNRRNNRPENLRWVTRLENILLNPITTRKIELICNCTIEEFLKDPSKFKEKFRESNLQWMSTVNPEEAKTSLNRLLTWAAQGKPLNGGVLSEWIYSRSQPISLPESSTSTDIPSLTTNALQRNWTTPCNFPLCPDSSDSNSLLFYANALAPETTFSENKHFSSHVIECSFSEDQEILWVICESRGSSIIKPITLAAVTIENGIFIHNSLGSFFELLGARSYLMQIRGIAWDGPLGIDEMCN